MGDKSAVIIGAGISGLTAAYYLGQGGWQVALLEARDRVGGRIWTHHSPSGLPIELGAEFIHGERVATWELIRQAGLATHEVPGRHWHTRTGRLQEDESSIQEVERVMAQIPRTGPDRSVQNFLDQNTTLTPLQRWLFREYVEGFHAANLTKMSACALAAGQAAAERDGDRQFRITAGYGALVDWLQRQITELGVKQHLRAIAHTMRWRPGSVSVVAQTPEGEQTFLGSGVIVTVPIALLKAVKPDTLVFDPRLSGHQEILHRIEMGQVLKIVLEFRERFWPVENFGFIHSSHPGLPT